MKLSGLGLTDKLSEEIRRPEMTGFTAGRVIREHRERYIVSDGENDYEAEVTGNLMYSASSRSDFPAVGDWVAMKPYDHNQAIIHKVLPRQSVLARQNVGKASEVQIIASNIDVAFIMQSLDNNFNINRIERYLAICYSGNIEPVVILSKTDLLPDDKVEHAVSELSWRDKEVRCFPVSNISGEGIDRLSDFIEKGKTYCVVGSSGVGKSSLINKLLKKNIMKTGEISIMTNKGKHITEHRELFVLENGGIIIDTPGMRELGLTNDSDGIDSTFGQIAGLAIHCRYSDCRHKDEKGCAVVEAIKNGIISKEHYDNYLKLVREQERFSATVAEKRRKDKTFGKMLRNYHRDMKKNDT